MVLTSCVKQFEYTCFLITSMFQSTCFSIKIFNYLMSINYFIEELNISDKDFKVSCSNASMFLVIMSLLKDSYSLDVNIFPLMIVNKKCYDLLNFNDCKIKFLRINSRSYLYPVNWFEGNGWIFQKYKENNKESLSAIAIFNFLIYSNFIYSLQELQIRLWSKDDNFEDDFNDLLAEFYKTNF